MFHLTELFHLLDVICEKQHQIVLLKLHHLLVCLDHLADLNVGVDQDGYLAAVFLQVVNDILNDLDIKNVDISTREKFNDNSELVVSDRGLQSWLQLEQAIQELFEPVE